MFYKFPVSRRLGALCLSAALLAGMAFVCLAQQSQPQPSFPGIRPEPAGPDAVWEEQQRKAMEKKANVQRQDEIKKDAAKLLELATELKQSVDKSNEHMLSLDVVKKAEQIEKLAKTVKDKMKGP